MGIEIERKELENGLEVVTYSDEWCESPRTMFSNVGTFYTWSPSHRIDSPDENPYSDPEELLAELLAETFCCDELAAAFASERFPYLRFDEQGTPQELLSNGEWDEAVCDWDPEDCEDIRREELAGVMGQYVRESEALLNERVVLLPVYRFEHSSVCYSTADFNDPWDSGRVGVIFAKPGDVRSVIGEGATRAQVIEALKEEVELYSQWANGDVYRVAIERDGEILDSMSWVTNAQIDEVTEELLEAAA